MYMYIPCHQYFLLFIYRFPFLPSLVSSRTVMYNVCIIYIFPSNIFSCMHLAYLSWIDGERYGRWCDD